MSDARISLSGAFVGRGAFRLGPLDFRVQAGELLWLRGHNGSGKSTLLHTVAGLCPLLEGELRIGGVVITPGAVVEPSSLGCALLLQDLGLWPHLTIRRQVELMAGGRWAGRPQLAAWAESLAVADLLDRRPQKLSGGEAQRCALLRTLAQERAVLLLDEPYSRQHESGIERIEQVLEQQREAGTAILVAGHRAVAGARELPLDAIVAAD